ncbi:hypothetical protein BHF71_10340 [Vulcanibacillus modesticaldus]|uniref:ABC transporter domain-containing protein n=1 Tax=Vulcanibacillus modesticaldus TaxID=337097 RepID=A0A1D2YSY0_9BACI|nr:ATP-binding cassette domain-containing protein [Vulcanibacillus modesticaldus]OEF98822.1 hypothetical protein BHF71_10340 [Vulcanibacillus modesticaldus]
MMYNSILVDPLLNISKVIKEWRKVNVSLKRLNKISPKINKKNEKDVSFDRYIELKNINYIVNDKEILKDINMKISKGEKVAIVGKSGSGKSTLIRILLGLIKPTSGSIIYDKYELDEHSNVLDNFSVLNQNCLIFNDSLRKNLELYTDYFDSEKLIDLIDRFGLSELFHEYNIETRIDSASGGEQKRIGLLRILLREANIYVFDELSNSL